MAYESASADAAGPVDPYAAGPGRPRAATAVTDLDLDLDLDLEPVPDPDRQRLDIPMQAGGSTRAALRNGGGTAIALPPVDSSGTWVRVPLPWWASTAAGPAAALAITVVGAVYLAWRAGTLGGTGVAGHLFYAAEVMGYFAIVWTAVMASRMRRGYVRHPPAPTGTLDVFVTVCGEPVEIVEKTLHAAMAIDYPHRTYVLNDGRIAGRDNWQEIDALAARLGLPCFTRIDGPRGKAANLNQALLRTNGDAIMTLDADHVAVPDLGEQVLGYLRDPAVAFVCTEQRFDVGRHDVLNNAELILYRMVQPARDRDDASSSCGNGTLYRRAALASVGGFSEWNIGEDLHTSYELHAAGWRSVYHPGHVSVGIAPATAAEYAKQRSRWTMDGLRILLFDNPLRKPGLTGWQRAHYLHGSVGCLLASVQMLFLVGPPLSVLAGVQFASGVSLTAYVLHALPYLLGSFLFVAAYIGPGGAQRTVASTLFNAPLYALAFLRVMLAGQPEAGVTAKAALPRMSVLLLPQWLFAAVLMATFAGFALDPDMADLSALVWAGVLLSMVAGPLSALSEQREAVERAQVPIRVTIAAVVLVLATIALIIT